MTRGNDKWVDYIPGEEMFEGAFTECVLYNRFQDSNGNEYVTDNKGIRWYFY